ncbi:hypothetical protein [uncultured Ruminococcus sp.]|uniref:hypothetical protein n=1 Tax=uncultured Ruminococcus sp. TaxID=165186 RepID=UPI0025F803CE|nr:hypothetical protein [uncultured Ruminococcus sp.]
MNEISLTDEMIRAFTDADPEQVRKAVNELHENEKDDELSLDMLEYRGRGLSVHQAVL